MIQNKQVIGVTGPTGSGKSYISRLFKEIGAFVIEADKIGHDVLINEAKSDILTCFGTLDRKEIGKAVFTSSEKLKILNNIMYPLIIKRILNIVEEHEFTVIDAALLFETGLDKYCTKIIYVLANRKSRLKRIMERDKITLEQAENRLKSQSAKIPDVNIVICNDYEKL
ncbi:MAG: dephospho-CoA kinase [Defluviitaleaceae bacterium]|nr:dephospho-CoA kinase [Defluviitaleaceae bacterium]